MDQTQEPIKIHHQPSEEEEHHENGATKMFRKVKAKAKKIKNSLTKHGQSHEHNRDVVEEDDEDDEFEPEAIGATDNTRNGVTSQPESLNHPREANVPAPQEIIPPGIKVFPVVSSDYTKPIEAAPLQDASYGHEALTDSVRTTDISDKEERRDAPIHHPLSELSDREERREAHHEGLNTPVSLLPATEDVTGTFAPGGEDEYLGGGQRIVHVEAPKNLEDDLAVTGRGSEYLSGAVSDYQSKVTDPTREGSGEAGVSDVSESLSRMNVSDEYPDQKSELGYERDLSMRSKDFQESVPGEDYSARYAGKGAELGNKLPAISHEFDQKTESGVDKSSPMRSHEFDMKTESAIEKSSPARFSREEAELGNEFPATSHEFDQRNEFGLNMSSPSRNHEFDVKNESSIDKNSPSRSHEIDLQNESGVDNNSPAGFDSESGADLGKEFPTERREFDQKVESGRNGNSRRIRSSDGGEFGGGLGAPTEGNFPVESQEVCLKNESEIRKDLSTGFGRESGKDFTAKGSLEYGEQKEDFFPTRNDDVKVETELGRDVPTGIHDQFSPELSCPKERDDFEETRDDFEETRDDFEETRDDFEETRDDFEETTQETKPSTYTEQFTSVENAVTSKLGYSGEKPVKDETEVADEKLSPVDEKNRETESTKLPFSGDGSGVERKDYVEDKGVSAKDYLSEKLTPGQEDKALSEVLAEKLKIGGEEEEKKEMEVKVEKSENSETIAAEEKGAGGGYVGMIKGWFGGGATEEVKPKSPHSVQESPQSLDTTVGTKDLSDFGGNELGETDGRGGVVPVQRGL